MAGNVAPIYSKVGDIQWSGTLTTGSNTYDGTNGANALVFAADATNGGYIEKLKFKALGTNVATCARIFINNGSTVATATNNILYGETSLPATTAASTSATIDDEYPLGLCLPPAYRVYVQLAATVAAGWVIAGVGGKY